MKDFPCLPLACFVLLAACNSDPSPAPATSAKPPVSAATWTDTSAPTTSASVAKPAMTAKLIEVDLSSAGDDYKGLFIQGPGSPSLLNKPGDPSVQFTRSADDPRAPEFTVTISHGKLDVQSMKKWVTDWAKDFSTPGKIAFVTDKPEEIEYSVELKGDDGKPEMAYGYGVEVKVGTDTYSCSAPNLSGPDLPVLKGVCRSLAKK